MKPPTAERLSAYEQLWRNLFFYFSAVMAAFALVDVNAGRMAHAMGDAGVTCLMISLMTQFPVVRAVIGSEAKAKSRKDLMHEAERLRHAHPWAERAGAAGWMLLFASLILRAFGVD